MGWPGERKQTGKGKYVNEKIPLPAGAEKVHSHPVCVRMPGVGVFIRSEAPLDMVRDQGLKTVAAKLPPLDLKYRSWNAVRKGAVSGDGAGFYGFRGYFVGLGWTNQEIDQYLMGVGQGMLDMIVKLHPYSYSLRRSCIAALSGEKPFTHETYTELSGVFGATLGRLRALIYHEENIHTPNVPQGDTVPRAMRENKAFHETARSIATHLPQTIFDFNPDMPEQFTILYYLPIPDVSTPPPATEAGFIIDKIGIVGLPLLRFMGGNTFIT